MGVKVFWGYRPEPPAEYVEKGIANVGYMPDYEGVVFSDGTVVLRWLTEFRSHSVWRSYEDFYQVHGHPEYGTEIVWAECEMPALEEQECKETQLRLF